MNKLICWLVYQSLYRLPLLLIVVFALALSVRPALAAPSAQAVTQQTLLVRFAEGTSPEMRDATVAQMGGEVVTWMHQINVAEIRLPVQEGLSAASMPFVTSDVVTYAESDWVVSGGSVVPNDPDFSDEMMSYGYEDVQAFDGWEISTGSQEIIIAVVDSGVKLDHPEFAGRLTAGYDFVNGDDRPDDDQGHGTHVAGIIAAALDNGQGVAGLCPNCRIMPVKVLDQNNLGTWSMLVQGILYAVDHGARVINLSLGSHLSSATLADAIAYAMAHDVVIVAAAGNAGSSAPYYPAALEGVIAVGATDYTGARWDRSNFGAYIDLTAPGDMIYSTYHDLNNIYRGYTYMSGTSMAAPFVSGVAGLLLSLAPTLSADQVAEALYLGAVDFGPVGWDVDYGHGRVSALGALLSPALELATEDSAPVVENPTSDSSAPGESTNQVMIFLPALGNR